MQLGGATTLQSAYDASTDPEIVLAASPGSLTLRDAATPIGDVFNCESNAGVDFFNIDPAQLNFGPAADRIVEVNDNPAGKGGIRYYPDGRAVTDLASQAMLQWDSVVTSTIPGGAPFGNDNAPAMISSTGECIFNDNAFLFATSLLFNQGTTISANVGNLGPIYTLIHQPTIRSVSAGLKTCSQMNAVRAQPRIGPNTAGSLTQTSAELFFATVLVDATIGTAAITDCIYFAAKAPTLTAGGTIGTLTCLDLPNIPAAGISNLYGILSAMGSGTFIRHTGAAHSLFTASNFRFNSNFGVELGTTQNVLMNWNGSALEFDPVVGDDLRWAFASGSHTLTSGGGTSELRIGHSKFAFGQTGAVGNQVGIFVAGTRSTSVAGEWSDFLLTQAGNITLNAAMSLVAGWTVNAPSITLGTGTVTTAGVLNVGGNVNQGSVNRFGVRILSNPSGGSGVNAALWVTAGSSRFDGRVDINRPIALGGGAAATLGTIGATGPTAAAQSKWVEIDVAGVPHWIPAWV